MASRPTLSTLLPARIREALDAGADPSVLCTPRTLRESYEVDVNAPADWDWWFPQVVDGHPLTARHALALRTEANVYGDLIAQHLGGHDPEAHARLSMDLPAGSTHLGHDPVFLVTFRHALHWVALMLTAGRLPLATSPMQYLAVRAALAAAADTHLLGLVEEDVHLLPLHSADAEPDGGLSTLAPHLLHGWDEAAASGPWRSWLQPRT